MMKSAAAVVLRAMRPIKQYKCIICGAIFEASDERARYCSNRCRQRAKTQRAKAKQEKQS